MVQGQRVKCQGHSVRNSQHRFTAPCLVFLLIYRVGAWRLRPPRARVVRGGSTWRLPGALRKTSENNIFKPNKPETQNVWRDVVRPSRCNAFAIARFVVCIFCHFPIFLSYQQFSIWLQLCNNLSSCRVLATAVRHAVTLVLHPVAHTKSAAGHFLARIYMEFRGLP